MAYTGSLITLHHILVGIWNKGVMTSYLQTCSISKSVSNHNWRVCNPKLDTNDKQEVDFEVGKEDREIRDCFTPV